MDWLNLSSHPIDPEISMILNTQDGVFLALSFL